MRILFVHRTFPGQFRYLASFLGSNPDNQVAFLSTYINEPLANVTKVMYKPSRAAHDTTHVYNRQMENNVLYGQAAYRAAMELKRQGLIPDVVISHCGWGAGLYMKDIFPQTPLLSYFEWFSHAQGTHHGFDSAFPITEDNKLEIRTKNASALLELSNADAGICPTDWQKSQFPREFHDKIRVIHDGVDTAYFCPEQGSKLMLPRLGLDLSHVKELVTYVATGMEPMRGFPQFMDCVAMLQKRRPYCHVVVVGEDRVEYSPPSPTGKTYKELALERHEYDLTRIHFTGRLTVPEYREVLKASSVHVYLTYPYILSWSVMEAMACECLLIGSNTSPVREVVEDGVTGLLVDFFSSEQIVDRVEAALDNPDKMIAIRKNAREMVKEKYDVHIMLERQMILLNKMLGLKR